MTWLAGSAGIFAASRGSWKEDNEIMTDDAAPQVPPRPVAGGREEPGGTGLALAQLVAEHHQSLYRYAYRLSGSAADAEDLVQQVFLVAHQKLDQIRDAQSVRAWLFTVLRNCYLK